MKFKRVICTESSCTSDISFSAQVIPTGGLQKCYSNVLHAGSSLFDGLLILNYYYEVIGMLNVVYFLQFLIYYEFTCMSFCDAVCNICKFNQNIHILCSKSCKDIREKP